MGDESLLAYAAVSYVWQTVRFIAAKAKVAPTKTISVARFELRAAVLGLRLARKVSELLEIPLRTVHYGQTAGTDLEESQHG